MHKISDSIDRKFIDSIDINDWEIETDTGWKDITHIHKTIEYDEWKLITESGLSLICADNHIIFDENYQEIFAKDLIPHQSKIITKNGIKLITSIESLDKKSNMFDITVDSDDHRFWSNDILSHNTTTTVAYLLWMILFKKDYTVGFLANKKSLAIEILDRLKKAYEYLPDWIQQGIVVWNRGNIELENGSKVYAYATSASGVRGGTYNCIHGDSLICISIDQEEFTISLYDIKNILTKLNTDYYIQDGSIYYLTENINVDIFKEQINRLNLRNNSIIESSTDRIKIKSEKGYVNFDGIKISLEKKQLIKVYLQNENYIICTPDHRIKTIDGWTEAKNCIDKKILTSHGFEYCKDIELYYDDIVYDILNVENTNSFYANDILVHNCILLDEFAHVDNNIADEFFTSTYPVISSGETTKTIIISTPKGMNLYYKMWDEAVKKRSLYIPFDVTWDMVPGRDEKWKENTIRNIGVERWDQEFGCEFIGSTSTLISGHKLKTLTYDNPISSMDGFDIYYNPIPGHLYVTIVDCSEGVDRDYSTINVIDVTQQPYVQVAKYRSNKIPLLFFPTIIYAVSTKYNEAYALVETNNIGQQVIDILHYELEYDNIIKLEKHHIKGQTISSGFKKNISFGVKTTKTVKKIGCANLKTLIENDKLIIKDFDTIRELTTFVRVRDSYEADDGENDDLVMGLVLFAWLAAQSYFKDTNNIDIRRIMLDEEKMALEDALAVPFILNDGLNNNIVIDTNNDKWLSDDNFNANAYDRFS